MTEVRIQRSDERGAINIKDVQNTSQVAPLSYTSPNNTSSLPPQVSINHPHHDAAANNLIDSSRLGFIRKVYTLLLIKFGITGVVSFITFKVPAVQRYLIFNMPIFWIMFAVGNVTYYTMLYFKKPTRIVPWNYILLFLYTASETYFVAFVCAVSNPRIVCAAALLTAAMVAGLTAYACYTRSSFTSLGVFLWAAGFVMVSMIFVGIFVTSKFFQAAASAVCILLSSIYLIYITQLICGDSDAALSIDDYVPAVMLFYTKVTEIFYEIVYLLGSSLFK